MGVEPTQAGRVSAGFFQTLGVHPVLGRDFGPEDKVPGGPQLVLMTYPTWKRRFGGRRSVLGEGLDLSGQNYTIIGVLPASFQFAPHGTAEFWTLIDSEGACSLRRSCHNLDGIARLKGWPHPTESLR